MNENSGLTLFATWDVATEDSLGKDLLDLLKIRNLNEYDAENIQNIVDLSKFVVLEESTNLPGPCQIRLSCPEFIQKVVVVADYPKMELFSGLSEICSYWKTMHGTHVSEFSELDTKIYRYDITCTNVTHLEMKLHTALTSIMVIGLEVYLHEPQSPSHQKASNKINFESVQDLLNNSTLTKGAENALSFMKNAPSSQSFGLVPSQDELMKMFSRVQTGSGNGSSGDVEALKMYLDVRLQQMETRILQRVREVEQVQNQKLDQILECLRK